MERTPSWPGSVSTMAEPTLLSAERRRTALGCVVAFLHIPLTVATVPPHCQGFQNGDSVLGKHTSDELPFQIVTHISPRTANSLS